MTDTEKMVTTVSVSSFIHFFFPQAREDFTFWNVISGPFSALAGGKQLPQKEIVDTAIGCLEAYSISLEDDAPDGLDYTRRDIVNTFGRKGTIIYPFAIATAILDVFVPGLLFAILGSIAAIYIVLFGVLSYHTFIYSLDEYEMDESREELMVIISLTLFFHSFGLFLVGLKLFSLGLPISGFVGIPIAISLFTITFAIVRPWRIHHRELVGFDKSKRARMTVALAVAAEAIAQLLDWSINTDGSIQETQRELLLRVQFVSLVAIDQDLLQKELFWLLPRKEEPEARPEETTDLA
jgi:hypothetical protein